MESTADETSKEERRRSNRRERATSPLRKIPNLLFWRRHKPAVEEDDIKGSAPAPAPSMTRELVEPPKVKEPQHSNSKASVAEETARLENRIQALEAMNEEMAEYQTELLSTVSAMRDELDIENSENEQTTKLLNDAQAELRNKDAKLAEFDQTKEELSIAKEELSIAKEELSIAKKKQATAEENVKSLQEVQKRSLSVISEVEAKVKIQHEEAGKVLAQRTSEVMSLRNDISRQQREHALLDQQLKGAIKDKEILERNAASRWCC